MIDRLRTFLNRPLEDSERRRLFAVTAAVIVAAAVVLGLAASDESAERVARRTAPQVVAAPPPTERPADPAELPVPSEEGPRSSGEQPAPDEIAVAKRAARAFLGSYFAYTYGRDSAAALPDATDDLRRALFAARPRVPAAERRRLARIEALTLAGGAPRRMGMLALVGDGRRRYSVELALARYPGGWKVTEVGG